MHELLLAWQWREPGKALGSWSADRGTIGEHCGDLGTTALSVLALQVYCRYPPK